MSQTYEDEDPDTSQASDPGTNLACPSVGWASSRPSRSIPPSLHPSDGGPPLDLDLYGHGNSPTTSLSSVAQASQNLGPNLAEPGLGMSGPAQSTSDATPSMNSNSVLAWLRCPVCLDQLEGPTTLRCGHTICSAHVQLQPTAVRLESPSVESFSEDHLSLPRSSTSDASDVASLALTVATISSDATNLNDLPSCPLDECHAKSSAKVTPQAPMIPSSSRVSYYPPPPSASSSTSSLPSTFHHPSPTKSSLTQRKRVAHPRQDITIGKILQLTIMASLAHDRQRSRQTLLVPTHPDPDSDTDSDEERGISAVTPVVPPDVQRPSLDRVSEQSSTRQGRPRSPPSSESGSPTTPGRAHRSKKRRIIQRTDEGPGLYRHPTLPRGEYASEDTDSEVSYFKELFQELQCEICFSLLHEPLTTPCQHTFCAKCLSRTLDHSTQCPLCRHELPGFAYFHDHPTNQMIQTLMIRVFPKAVHDRRTTLEDEEKSARLDTPVFVCQLSFPGLPTILHIFEPRYRLMIRRCLQSANPSFGMIMPQSAAAADADQFGTMLEIQSVQMLPDGRSMVETKGTHRFKILEKGILDGYVVARIETIEDCPLEAETLLNQALVGANWSRRRSPSGSPPLPISEPSVEEMMKICREFYEHLKSGTAPWVVQQLNNAYGSMPSDPSTFSYWMAMLLPIDEAEKAKLLPMRSPRLRLRLLVHWIESLNNSWWFGSGCMIT